MKKIILFLVFLFSQAVLFSQIEGQSGTYSFSIKKKIEPPILTFPDGSVRFSDVDGNNIINANESCELKFKLSNTGIGDGTGLKAKLSATGNADGITFSNITPIANAIKGKEIEYRLPISSNMSTVDGSIELTLFIEEPNGFNTDEVKLEIQTKKFAAPDVQVVDFIVYAEDGSKQLEYNRPFNLQLLVQNTGQGIANNVQVKLPMPNNVFLTSGEDLVNIGTLLAGEQRSLEYSIVISKKFTNANLNLAASLTESYGKYAKNWSGNFQLNQSIASQKLVVDGKVEEQKDIQVASLRSDVDKDIPTGIASKQNRYALIIGNEDYSSKQPGLEKEVNVDFAANDARVFAEYAEKVLGYPKENIRLLTDATKGTMSQGVDWLVKKAQAQGDAEIIFYYSGHGLPEEISKEPYLIPVDVSGTQVQNGLSLIRVYELLAQSTAKKCVVVLDACFSGGARNKELTALKGVKVKASVDEVPG
ncbi:MAG: caspase family protein, partial [Bacteroidota bacterium]